LSNEWFDVFAVLGFINLCINPLIYAARYEVFRKTLRRMYDVAISMMHPHHTDY